MWTRNLDPLYPLYYLYPYQYSPGFLLYYQGSLPGTRGEYRGGDGTVGVGMGSIDVLTPLLPYYYTYPYHTFPS